MASTDDDGGPAATRDAAGVGGAGVGGRVRPGTARGVVPAGGGRRRSPIRRALGRQRRLADAELAGVTGVGALGDLCARRALGGVVEVRRRATAGQSNGGTTGDGATAEAVAAVRNQRLTALHAGVGLRRRGRALGVVLGGIS